LVVVFVVVVVVVVVSGVNHISVAWKSHMCRNQSPSQTDWKFIWLWLFYIKIIWLWLWLKSSDTVCHQAV